MERARALLETPPSLAASNVPDLSSQNQTPYSTSSFTETHSSVCIVSEVPVC